MDKKEYNEVKEMTYKDFFTYLINKYGTPSYPFELYDVDVDPESSLSMIEISMKKRKEGLYVHHFFECFYPEYILVMAKTASKYPKEYQYKDNLCYCNLLEHMYLHILIGRIVRDQGPDKKLFNDLCGIDVSEGIMPVVNDALSGRYDDPDNPNHMLTETIKGDKAVYLTLVERFRELDKQFNKKRKTNWFATTSYDRFMTSEVWDVKKELPLYRELANTLGEELNEKKIK